MRKSAFPVARGQASGLLFARLIGAMTLSFRCRKWISVGAFVGVFLLPAPLAAASRVTIAVAANFAAPAEELARRFAAETGQEVSVVSGSTGKHYAQIVNGAPFDLFLAADADSPRRLESEGLALSGSRFTYAVGRLVLWSRLDGLVDAGGEVLRFPAVRHLAIANPRLAPYGRAALEVLENLGVAEMWSDRLVLGENVAQAFQFVATGNAELGLVALAQVRAVQGARPQKYWLVPDSLHAPIEQQAIVLRDSEQARAFLAYLASPRSRRLIRTHGYETPK